MIIIVLGENLPFNMHHKFRLKLMMFKKHRMLRTALGCSIALILMYLLFYKSESIISKKDIQFLPRSAQRIYAVSKDFICFSSKYLFIRLNMYFGISVINNDIMHYLFCLTCALEFAMSWLINGSEFTPYENEVMNKILWISNRFLKILYFMWILY